MENNFIALENRNARVDDLPLAPARRPVKTHGVSQVKVVMMMAAMGRESHF